MKVTAVLGVLALGATVGCGGGSTVGGPVPLSQLPSAWAQTVCAQNFKCASAADIMMKKQSDCLQNNTMLWQLLVASVQDGQSKGRVAYDPAQEGMCLAALAGETCAQWTTGLAHDVSCPEAYTPKVAAGGTCGSNVECVAGYCDGADATATPPKDGTCKPTVAHGAACMFGDTCVQADYCDDTAMMCVGKKPGGAACQSDDECGNSCNTDTSQCSGYAGCAVAPTPRGAIASLVGLALAVAAARRQRRIT